MKRRAQHRRQANTLSKKLAKTLIATTLTAGAAGTAGADPIDELAVGGDFEDFLTSANLLEVGTNVVTGNNDDPNSQFAEPDFFTFSGLEPNVGFTLHVERTGGTITNVSVHDPGATLPRPSILDSLSGSPVDLAGTIPASGMLIFEASGGEGVSYRVTLSAPLSVAVPAPSTLALTALGAALTGVFARRRRTVRRSATS